MDLKNFEKAEYFVNRELSWLKFDDRVLSEARDKSLPLFERLKFTSIVSSNLDEFYMVRVASLKDQVHAGYEKTDIAGMGPKEQLKEISVQTHELVRSQYSLSAIFMRLQMCCQDFWKREALQQNRLRE